MATVTGNVYTVADGPRTDADHITIGLRGYGSQVPRINGTGMLAGLDNDNIPIDGTTGQFTVQLYGNDIIAPAGTYYTFTFSNANGDVVQVNAYRFVDGQTYDLNLIDPYDPNQPPPPFPPLITNLLLILPAADDMVFDGSIYTAFKTTLPGDVTSPVFQNMVPGNLYTFIIAQDSRGGWAFKWPTNVHNATLVSPPPNSTTIQTFVADDTEQLWAIAPGTWSQ
jgi:hypothetical protein